MTTATPQTTTFDGSQNGPGPNGSADDVDTLKGHGLTGLSALDAIGEQIAERDAEEETTTAVAVPGLNIRLICSTVVPYEEYQKWQMTALPLKERKSRRPKPLAMSQLILACMVLINTCEAIEHQVDGEWQPMIGSNGEAFTLESDELLRRFNIIDPNTFVKKLFGRDPRVLKAAEEVMIASQWLEDEDELDPTA